MIKRYLKMRTSLAVTGLVFAVLCPSVNAADKLTSNRTPAIEISQKKVTNGSLLSLQFETCKSIASITAPRIRFHEKIYPLYPHPANPACQHFVLIAIPFRTAPGPAKVELTWATAAGSNSKSIPFEIVAGDYKTDLLTVDIKRVNPNAKNRQRAQEEARRIKRIYAAGSSERFWKNEFQLPMTSKITSFYGNKRIFNGQLKSFHNGIDFRAAVGTPVVAANAGIVKLAENLFYSGKAVIIDHGTGIFTIYAHLSGIDVAVNQHVKKGQQIGLTGATGRVNGPHLHWGVKINQVPVNPLQFTEVISSLVEKK